MSTRMVSISVGGFGGGTTASGAREESFTMRGKPGSKLIYGEITREVLCLLGDSAVRRFAKGVAPV